MALYDHAAEARAAIEAEERRYREGLHWCPCARALPERVYLQRWACRLCGRAIRQTVQPWRRS
jgi:ribosomal protein L37AE/L43A